MDKVKLEDATQEILVGKVNEIIDCLNAIHEERIEELKRKLNEIKYGRYMAETELIMDMKFRLGIH